MDNNAGTVLLVLCAAVCLGIPVITGKIFIDSPGGHEGDEINVYCRIRNFEGVSVFYRHVDNKNVTMSPSSKYHVLRCNKTTIGVSGEDSVLIITQTSELDSGTYGCAPNVNGNINWGVGELTNVTVKPVCSGMDYTNPPPLTTHPKEQGQNKPSTQGEDNEQSSGNTGLIAAVVFLSLAVLTLTIAFAVASWKLFRIQRNGTYVPKLFRIQRNGTYVPPDRQGVGEADGNTTELGELSPT